jgi:hypothetical protein
MDELANRRGLILDLRRVVYRCEVLQRPALSDETRQSLWESVLVALADIKQLNGCQQATHEQICQERSRHVAEPDLGVVIPDGVSLEDVETGCLAAPCVDPAAARILAEDLIKRLEAELDPT